MAAFVLWEFQKLIAEKLLQDETLNRFINKRVYDMVPPNPIFPYIVLGQDTSKAWNSKTNLGSDIVFVLHIFTRDKGRRELKNIMNNVHEILTKEEICLESHFLIQLYPEFMQSYIESDQMTCHGVIRLHALAVMREDG